jgi:hypothetical protein
LDLSAQCLLHLALLALLVLYHPVSLGFLAALLDQLAQAPCCPHLSALLVRLAQLIQQALSVPLVPLDLDLLLVQPHQVLQRALPDPSVLLVPLVLYLRLQAPLVLLGQWALQFQPRQLALSVLLVLRVLLAQQFLRLLQIHLQARSICRLSPSGME